jgi:hypothetical protein
LDPYFDYIVEEAYFLEVVHMEVAVHTGVDLKVVHKVVVGHMEVDFEEVGHKEIVHMVVGTFDFGVVDHMGLVGHIENFVGHKEVVVQVEVDN